MSEWQDLTKLTQGEPILVERVRLTKSDIAIEGAFELPPIAQLSAEDQVFVMAFVRSHGSIKDMERVFGVSYPTIKNRLNRIAERLPLIQVEMMPEEPSVLDQLDRGEITASEAIERLSGP